MLWLGAAILCVYALAGTEGAAIVNNSCSRDLDANVLILGGGMGGVSTAARLMSLGEKSFMLFEAGDRLGGRMRRMELIPNVFFAEGPAYIHGVDRQNPSRQPIYNLMQRCGGLQGMFVDGDSVTVYRGSTDISSQASEIDGAFNSALRTTENYAERISSDISFRQGFQQSGSGWAPSNDLDRLIEWYNFDFDYAESPDVSSLLGSLDELTDSGFLAGGDQSFDYFIDDEKGYVELINCLARDFVNNRSITHLNSLITKINNTDECVCVEAVENGVTNQYCGRYAVLTFSIGVLKSASFRNVLTPFFSQARQDAMRPLSMARYQNTFAVFSERFWDTDTFFVAREVSQRGFFPVLANAFVRRNNINAVIMPTTGDVATQVAGMSQQALNQSVTDFFTGIYGSRASPPIHLFRESYLTNPLFLGSYLHVGVGYSSEAHRSLLSPEGSLYFAGEAYHRNHFGNINGAYLSGNNTADTVWRALGNSGMKFVVNGHFVPLLASFVYMAFI